MTSQVDNMEDAAAAADRESRNYSRISCFLRAMYRPLGHPEEPQLCAVGLDQEDKGLRERFSKVTGMPENVVAFMLHMDAKLDNIIAHLSRDALATYFQKQLVVLDLSASGLLVQANDLQPGSHLELVIFLSEFPSLIASGIAGVLRAGRPVPGVGQTYALKFSRLRDTDREQIVRYVFKENRERIRSNKLI
jgi:c-di-GMP-binding flagellar brake protein YcgR